MLDVTGTVQVQELRRQLRYLHEHSDFYAHKFRAEGLAATDLERIDDLPHLPFTVKEELRESQVSSPPLGRHAAVPMSRVTRVHASTGTTGRASCCCARSACGWGRQGWTTSGVCW